MILNWHKKKETKRIVSFKKGGQIYEKNPNNNL